MKVLQCMASVAPERGGPSVAVRSLSSALVDAGAEVTVAAHDDGRGDRCVLDDSFDARVDLRTFRLTTSTWQLSVPYLAWLRRNIGRYDFVLIHSLFLSHSWAAALLARRAAVSYAVRPHGSLTTNDLQSRRPRAKALYIRAIERRSLDRAAFIFCTSEQEADASRAMGFSNSVVIPLGVPEEYFGRPRAERSRTTMVYLGRLAPKKGADLVVRSLAAPEATAAGLDAVIVGPDDHGLRAQLQNLALRLGVQHRVQFRGFVDGDEKAQLLDRAGMFVLPSRDENFGVASAEALALGLPQLLTAGVSHALAVEAGGAGVMIERDPQAIAAAAARVSGLAENDYRAMCDRARELARTRYRWSSTARRFLDLAASGCG